MARQRVLVPQALGAEEFLRATWHDDKGVVVFSQWDGERCIAATPVRVSELGELTSLLVGALGRAAAGAGHDSDVWAPPNPALRVVGGPLRRAEVG